MTELDLVRAGLRGDILSLDNNIKEIINKFEDLDEECSQTKDEVDCVVKELEELSRNV